MILFRDMLRRYLDRKFRLKPSFIILGAQRSGTTTMYQYLINHPSVYGARKKEIHFFDYYYENGLTWYSRNFPFNWFRRKNIITGEATPYYLFHPFVPDRIKQFYPKMKFIVLLRNPIHRAYSHYKLNKLRAIESLSFSEAIAMEELRIACDWDRVLKGQRDLTYGHQHFSYLSRGKYMVQLKKWNALFPREQFLFIRSEKFFSEPQKTLQEVFSFLGIENVSIEYSEIYNQSMDQSVPDRELIEELTLFFEKDNTELSCFLQDGFNW